MKRLRVLILVFILALAVPLGYLVVRTERSLEREETAELRFFANTLFDQMEQELAELVQREERRPVEEYFSSSGWPGSARPGSGFEDTGRSPLPQAAVEPYILGYLQNNPDGSFSTPMPADGSAAAQDQVALTARLREVNRMLNVKRSQQPGGMDRQPEEPVLDKTPALPKEAAVRKEEAGKKDEGVARQTEKEAKKAEIAAKKTEEAGFADKYLDFSRSSKQKVSLGQAEKRVEQISPQQAMNLAPKEEKQQAAGARSRTASSVERPAAVGTNADEGDATAPPVPPPASSWSSPSYRSSSPASPQAPPSTPPGPSTQSMSSAPQVASQPPAPPSLPQAAESSLPQALQPSSRQAAQSGSHQAAPRPPAEEGLRVEVDPLQSIPLDHGQVLMFRRIVIGQQMYRQGLVIQVGELLDQLKNRHFTGQPMARFTHLTLTAAANGRETTHVQDGIPVTQPRFTLERSFPRPFAFVRATLTCDEVPRSAGRATLHLMVAVLAGVILLGLLAIYHSARVVTDLSERRSGFVSSVTHELKTPLTNIRMYIEMLEHGIASSPEREMEYYRILGSESARLSRLINNVLEFSKLEKRQRQLDLREGALDEVFAEVGDVMRERLRQEGFTLIVENLLDRPFKYDREVMVQVLINLIDNSVKFGRGATRREIAVSVRPEGNRVLIRVADTGPGIPRQALAKIFDDFYRVDNDLTRTTKGTGIGLALVKRFVQAMGGRVSAANNNGPGCTITLSLPGTRTGSSSRRDTSH